MWNSIVSWVSRELNSATLKQNPLQINWKASIGPLLHLQYGQIGIREANILSNHRNLHLHKALSCIIIQKKILKTLRTGIVGGGSSIIQTELVRLSKVSALFVHSCKSGCAMLTLKLHNQPSNRLIILHLISQLQHKWFLQNYNHANLHLMEKKWIRLTFSSSAVSEWQHEHFGSKIRSKVIVSGRGLENKMVDNWVCATTASVLLTVEIIEIKHWCNGPAHQLNSLEVKGAHAKCLEHQGYWEYSQPTEKETAS